MVLYGIKAGVIDQFLTRGSRNSFKNTSVSCERVSGASSVGNTCYCVLIGPSPYDILRV